MLQSFRDNTQGIVVKIIIGLIIITFALFGVDSLVGLATQEPAPVSVNGEDITKRDIAEQIDLQRRQLIRQLGPDADPSLLEDAALHPRAVEQLIEQQLRLQSAKDQGLYISEQFLDAAILATPEFQSNGTFDRNRFESMVRNVGMTPMMYREYLREQVLTSQSQNAVQATTFILPNELDRIRTLDRQTRSYRVIEFKAEDVLDSIEISDDEVQAYYDQNTSLFKSEEQVSVDYVELSKRELAQSIDIDDATLNSAYDDLVSNFDADEAREAAHILISIDDNRSAEQALEKIQDIEQQLRQGADFAELAKEYSEDPGSAEQGGDLGFVEKGIMVPEFEDALFALQEGQLSEPVQTDYGYHLIKLGTIETAEAPSFADAKDSLLQELRLNEVEALFLEKQEELDDLRYSSADLQEASSVMDLEIKTTGLFGREGGELPMTQSPELLRAAFSDEVLQARENSGLIQIDNDRVVVIHINTHNPERAQALEEVKDDVVATLKQAKAVAQAQELAKYALSAIEKGEPLAEDLYWQEYDEVGRADPGVNPELGSAVFKMPKPVAGEPSYKVLNLSEGDSYLVALDGVEQPSVELTDQQTQALQNFLATHFGREEYSNQLSYLKATAEVERR